MNDKLEDLRVAIAGINQGSVQRALRLVLEILEAQECTCSCGGREILEMYPAEAGPATTKE